MDVPDAEQPEIRVAVKRLCVNDLISGKQTFLQSVADTGIQRPPVFEELSLNKREEIGFLEKLVVPAAHLAVFLISGLSGGGFIGEDVSFVQYKGGPIDLDTSTPMH